MAQVTPTNPKRIYRSLMVCLAVLVGCFFCSFWLLDRLYTRSVERSAPPGFPVLVMSADKPQIVRMSELKEFLARQPEYSFLVPSGQEAVINQNLVAAYVQQGIKATPHVRVSQINSGIQALEVGARGDGGSIGWYEATDKEVFPKHYKSFGPGFIFLVVLLALILSALSLLLWARFSNSKPANYNVAEG